MESQPSEQRVQYSPELRQALEDGSGEQILAAIELSHGNPVIEAIGLRLQLKDYWIDRKADLSLAVDTAETQDLDTVVGGVLRSADYQLSALRGAAYYDDTSTVKTPEELSESRKQRLISEIQPKSDKDKTAFMARFGALAQDELASPRELEQWTHEWRNIMVEQLWAIATDFRDANGSYDAVKQQFNDTALQLSSDINGLITGAVYHE